MLHYVILDRDVSQPKHYVNFLIFQHVPFIRDNIYYIIYTHYKHFTNI